MQSQLRKVLSCCRLMAAVLMVGCAQRIVAPTPPPAPDVIAKVTSAKKIFVSNLGEEPAFVNDIPGGANVTYDEFYADLKQWGYFQLVDLPAKADLIFQIQGTEKMADVEHTGKGLEEKDYTVTPYPALLNLSIIDASTHSPVYTIILPAGRAWALAKGKIAFSQSIDTLTGKVKALVVAPASQQNP